MRGYKNRMRHQQQNRSERTQVQSQLEQKNLFEKRVYLEDNFFFMFFVIGFRSENIQE